jgi:hypothetical protein
MEADRIGYEVSISIMPNGFVIDMVGEASKMKITERSTITYDEMAREQDWNPVCAALADMAQALAGRGASPKLEDYD